MSDDAVRIFRNNLNTSALNWHPVDRGLVEKDWLAQLVKRGACKSSNSTLVEHSPETYSFDIDDSDTVENRLYDAEVHELESSLDRNKTLQPHRQEWWILKPAVSSGGTDVHLFATLDELESLFEPTRSNLRKHCRFVCQRYVQNPLLLQPGLRKFHVRTYALALGSLKVYVFPKMLALFAPKQYQHPGTTDAPDVHLTNTSLQSHSQALGNRCIFDDLTEESGLGPSWKKDVVSQICEITSDSFATAVESSPTTFQLLSNCFQLFGVDFLVDQTGKVWLLEFHSGPAFTRSDVIPDMFDSIVASKTPTGKEWPHSKHQRLRCCSSWHLWPKPSIRLRT